MHFLFYLTFHFTIKGQFLFQDPATSIMENIIDLHHDIMFFLILLTFLILGIIFRIVVFFTKKNTILNVGLTHTTIIDVIGNLIPLFILFLITVPSYVLIYQMDEINDPHLTVKIIDHQGYGSYEYADFIQTFDTSLGNDLSFVFDSFMIKEEDFIEKPLHCFREINEAKTTGTQKGLDIIYPNKKPGTLYEYFGLGKHPAQYGQNTIRHQPFICPLDFTVSPKQNTILEVLSRLWLDYELRDMLKIRRCERWMFTEPLRLVADHHRLNDLILYDSGLPQRVWHNQNVSLFNRQRLLDKMHLRYDNQIPRLNLFIDRATTHPMDIKYSSGLHQVLYQDKYQDIGDGNNWPRKVKHGLFPLKNN